MTQMLRIRNWQKFQHYKERNPPWVKLHVEIFSSEDWVSLDDAGKLLALVCIGLASKHDGCIPNNPAYIKRVAYLNRVPNLKPLIACGFLENSQADASEMPATLADARPEKETEYRDRDRAEKKQETPSASKKAIRRSLPDGFPFTETHQSWAVIYWSDRKRDDLCANIGEEVEKFRDHHVQAATMSADWPATWRTWVRNAMKFNPPPRGDPRAPAKILSILEN